MIEIPKTYTPVITPTQNNAYSRTNFNGLADNNKKKDNIVERRLSPTRRRSNDKNQAIERRVSSDRRRPSFSGKA